MTGLTHGVTPKISLTFSKYRQVFYRFPKYCCDRPFSCNFDFLTHCCLIALASSSHKVFFLEFVSLNSCSLSLYGDNRSSTSGRYHFTCICVAQLEIILIINNNRFKTQLRSIDCNKSCKNKNINAIYGVNFRFYRLFFSSQKKAQL